DRAGVRQVEGAAAHREGADGGGAVGVPGAGAGRLHPPGVPQLSAALWVRRYSNLENALAAAVGASARATRAAVAAARNCHAASRTATAARSTRCPGRRSCARARA